MKRFSGFVLGVLTTVMVIGFVTTALALSGTISFSPVNVVLNGQQVAATGDNYTLADGKTQVPYSLMYVDEHGGGTTYLPVRKISELLVFYKDIMVSQSGNYFSAWELRRVLAFALDLPYEVVSTSNPNIDYVQLDTESLENTFKAGRDEKQYISATEVYEPLKAKFVLQSNKN